MQTNTSSLMDGKDYNKNNSQRFDEFMDIVKQLPQQEISDEEIENVAWEKYTGDSARLAWVEAIKWYREQLKSKQ